MKKYILICFIFVNLICWNQIEGQEFLDDHFMIIADSFLTNVYQFSLDSTYGVAISATNPIAVAYDDVRKDVYWTDVKVKVILKLSLDARRTTVVFRDVLSVMDGITLDVGREKIYYSDARINGIVCEVSMNGTNQRIISTSLGSQPRGIAIDTEQRMLYWSDWSSKNPGIFSSPVIGSSQTRQIISGNLLWPNAFTVDFKARLMYWGDAGLHKIEMANLDGSGRTLIVDDSLSKAHYFGMSLTPDYVYFSDWSDRTIRRFNRKTFQLSQGLTIRFRRPNGIAFYRSNLTASATTTTLSQSDSAQPTSTAKSVARRLLELPQDNFVLVADLLLTNLYQISFETGEGVSISATAPVGVAYDNIRKEIYWTDVNLKLIKKLSLVNQSSPIVYEDELSIMDGITLDVRREKIYYSDARINGRVCEISMDGTNQRIISTSVGSQPRGIVFNAETRMLYWSDWSATNPGIFSVPVDDPAQKMQIVSGNLKWPNALAIDFTAGVMYWGDAGLHKIEMSNLDGSGRTVIANEESTKAHYFAMHLTPDHVYFSDWTDETVRRIHRRTFQLSYLIPQGLSRPSGIFIIGDPEIALQRSATTTISTTSTKTTPSVTTEESTTTTETTEFQTTTLLPTTVEATTPTTQFSIKDSNPKVDQSNDVEIKPVTWHLGVLPKRRKVRQTGSYRPVNHLSKQRPALKSRPAFELDENLSVSKSTIIRPANKTDLFAMQSAKHRQARDAESHYPVNHKSKLRPVEDVDINGSVNQYAKNHPFKEVDMNDFDSVSTKRRPVRAVKTSDGEFIKRQDLDSNKSFNDLI